MKPPRCVAILALIISILSTILPTSVAQVEQGEECYKIKIVVKTDSDWSDITPLPPWDKNWIVAESNILRPDKDDDDYNAISHSKLKVDSPSYNNTLKEVEFIVYFKAQSEDMELTIVKGAIGTTRIEIFNICSEKEYRMKTYTQNEGPPNTIKIPIEKIIKFGKVSYPPQNKQ